jgi:hypothetical protein
MLVSAFELICLLDLFIFTVMTNKVEFTSAIFLFDFYTSCFFLVPLLPFFFFFRNYTTLISTVHKTLLTYCTIFSDVCTGAVTQLYLYILHAINIEL